MNYIFDFDGTVCDSFDITIKILNEYLFKFKKKLIDPKEFREKGIEKIIGDYKLSKLQILIYIYKGRKEIAKNIHDMKTFPQMEEVLKELSKSSVLGIVSSNSKKNIEIFLKDNHYEQYFSFVATSLTIFQKSKKIEAVIRKNKFNKNETVYIGDEVRDIQAAKKAGVKSVSVSWGFAGEELLKTFNPDLLIGSPKELLSVEKQLLH